MIDVQVAPPPHLTPRQYQVLQQIADGKTLTEIGRDLLISKETAKSTLFNAMVAMDARNRAHAMGILFRCQAFSRHPQPRTDAYRITWTSPDDANPDPVMVAHQGGDRWTVAWRHRIRDGAGTWHRLRAASHEPDWLRRFGYSLDQALAVGRITAAALQHTGQVW